MLDPLVSAGPTLATVPFKAPVVPLTVTSAGSPTFSSATWLLVTDVVTSKLPALMIVTASVVDSALTVCPVARATETTVPAIGVVSWAEARL